MSGDGALVEQAVLMAYNVKGIAWSGLGSFGRASAACYASGCVASRNLRKSSLIRHSTRLLSGSLIGRTIP